MKGKHWFGVAVLLLVGFAVGLRFPGALGSKVQSTVSNVGA
jgi:hypothetical protein